jgi:hypothetical protein
MNARLNCGLFSTEVFTAELCDGFALKELEIEQVTKSESECGR